MIDNCAQVTKQLLTVLNIKHTTKYLKDSILSHPDYPSLLTVSDTLEKYKIETLAVKIDVEKLQEMPLPCIVQQEINRQPLFFVLKNVFKNKVLYYDDKKKLIEKSKDNFFKEWTGICLLVETTKKLSLKNLKLDANDMLQRNQLKSVFGGYGGYGETVECRCKNKGTGAAWFASVSSCDVCTSSWCDNHVPSGSTWTSLICTGPLGGGGYGY